jgi:hypothetical protein
MAAKNGRQLQVQPLDVLADQVVAGIKAGTYCISANLAADAGTLHERARRLAAGQWPTITDGHGILG